MRHRVLPLAAGLAALAAPAGAQVRAGEPFRVNTYTTGQQAAHAVPVNAAGEFVVVWTEAQSNQDSRGRFFASEGTAQGQEFLVNSYTTLRQSAGGAVLDERGRLLATWTGQGPGCVNCVWAGRRDRSGAGAGDFQVSAANATALAASLARLPNRTFVVVWTSGSIFGRRLDADGRPLGAAFMVNAPTADRPGEPAVAADAAGRFTVVWQQANGANSSAIVGQRFDAQGGRLGSEFIVDANTTDAHRAASVAATPDGRFVVTWVAYRPPLTDYRLFARRYDAAGAPLGGPVDVRSPGGHAVFSNDVGVEESGAFVVAWEDYDLINRVSRAWARRFDGGGQAREAEFELTTVPPGELFGPHVGLDPVGNFVVAFTRFAAAPQAPWAQRFGGLQPAALAVDTAATPHSNGNGVLEPNENIDMRTTWRNVNGAAQTFAGTLAVERPGEPSPAPRPFPYSVEDGAGDYGTAASGAPRECTDCYSVRTFTEPEPPAPSPSPWIRPPGHVDGAVWETITPDAQGQHKKWLLHLGMTFTDVLVAGPFYRFIETLVHNGVTTGCTTTTYCPTQAVTREQMAVFVLTAEDRDAGPPLCTTPAFSDVPASSPFCRWIEELARRGVTAGCTPTTYCPGDSVTREQMAVFVLRTFDPNLSPPACTTPIFSDLPASSPYCRWVEELVRRGVVAGCGGGRYCGGDPVTREQMAVYLTGTFGLRLYGP